MSSVKAKYSDIKIRKLQLGIMLLNCKKLKLFPENALNWT